MCCRSRQDDIENETNSFLKKLSEFNNHIKQDDGRNNIIWPRYFIVRLISLYNYSQIVIRTIQGNEMDSSVSRLVIWSSFSVMVRTSFGLATRPRIFDMFLHIASQMTIVSLVQIRDNAGVAGFVCLDWWGQRLRGTSGRIDWFRLDIAPSWSETQSESALYQCTGWIYF